LSEGRTGDESVVIPEKAIENYAQASKKWKVYK